MPRSAAILTSSRYTELLAQARQELGVPEAAGITDVVALLGAWGATPMPVGSFDTNLCDEYVDEALVVYQASIDDVHLIAEHLTDDEREGFSPDDSDESSDDLEATNTGATDDWSEVSDDLDAGRRGAQQHRDDAVTACARALHHASVAVDHH